MGELHQVVGAVYQVIVSVAGLVRVIFGIFADHWAFFCWVAFWLFCVRWSDLFREMRRGAWVAVVLLYVAVAWTWGVNSEPVYLWAGRELSSVFEKFIIVALWFLGAFLCGWLQLTWGMEPAAVEIAGPPEAEAAGHGHGHGHGSSHGHGHDH